MLHTQIMERARSNAVRLSPQHLTSLANEHSDLVNFQPQTKVGKIAQALAVTLAGVRLSVASTTAYVFAITENSVPPSLTFHKQPSGVTINLAQLQSDYDNFCTKYKTLQSGLTQWISTDSSNSNLSIYSKLTSVPTSIDNLDSTIQAKFTILANLEPSNPLYPETLNELQTLIHSNCQPVSDLITDIQNFAENANNAANYLNNQTTSGTLVQLLNAYQQEVTELAAASQNIQNSINANNSEISTLKKEEIAAATVTAVGAANWWNPFGWVALAGGGASLGVIRGKISNLEASNAKYTGQIQQNNNWADQDQAAAGLLTLYIPQLKNFVTMNTAAQEELTYLSQLYQTLGNDLHEAIHDLTPSGLGQAHSEWNTCVSFAKNLELATLYAWPSPQKLNTPNDFYGVTDGLYVINEAGYLYYWQMGAPSWQVASSNALSVTRSGTETYIIQGAPAPNPNPNNIDPSNYLIYQSTDLNNWSNIPGLGKASQIVASSATLFAIKQDPVKPTCFQYLNNQWSALGDFGDTDIVKQLLTTNNQLFCITNNSGDLYINSNGKWNALGYTNLFSGSGNGTFLGLINRDNKAYCYDGSTMTTTYSNALKVAQLTNGDQYIIDNQLNLYHVFKDPSKSAVLVMENIINVTATDNNCVFFASGDGSSIYYNLNPVNADGLANVDHRPLPSLPTT